MRQLFESERIIRVASLIKFSSLDLKAITDLFAASGDGEKDDDAEEIEKIVAEIEKKPTPVPTLADSNAIFYVSGALVRSELRQRVACESCAALLKVGSNETLTLSCMPDSDASVRLFADEINRGGLLTPSDLAFAVCLRSWSVFQLIVSEPSMKNLFLTNASHRACFIALVRRTMDSDDNLSEIVSGQDCCAAGHPIVDSLIRRFFHCLMVNFLKDLKADCAKENKRRSLKLQSKKSD